MVAEIGLATISSECSVPMAKDDAVRKLVGSSVSLAQISFSWGSNPDLEWVWRWTVVVEDLFSSTPSDDVMT